MRNYVISYHYTPFGVGERQCRYFTVHADDVTEAINKLEKCCEVLKFRNIDITNIYSEVINP